MNSVRRCGADGPMIRRPSAGNRLLSDEESPNWIEPPDSLRVLFSVATGAGITRP